MADATEMTPLQAVAGMEDGVRENILALQSLQKKYQDLFLDFCKEKDALEAKYEEKYAPLYNRRREIVSGTVDASEEEIKKGEELQKKDEDESKIEEIDDNGEVKESKPVADDTLGISDFWFIAMSNEDTVAGTIEECDNEILSHLVDVRCKTTSEPNGFVLTFEFSENEFFTNKELTKAYETKLDDKDGEQLLYKAHGCKIEWKDGKNVTCKIVKKKQSSKSGKGTRVVEKTVPKKSFFGFFEPPFAEDEDLTDEIAERMEEDFMIGTVIKESIIPRAISWFTGEAAYNSFEGFDFGDDDEEDEEEEEGAPKQDCKQQ